MDRFSGLYADPNYYSVNLIIALALLVLLYYRKEIKLIPFAGLVVALLSFVVLTYSKSSFLMLLLPIYMFLYANFRGKRYYTLVLSLILFAFAFFFLLDGKLDMFSTVLARFGNSDQLSNLTTGRSYLWQNYLNHFSKSFPLLLFGNGFDAELLGKMAPHNTYIDLLYYLGILGTVLLFVTLSLLNKPNRTPHKKTFLNRSVLLVVLAMYFFLSQLFYFDMPFHILLALMVLNADLTDHAATRK